MSETEQGNLFADEPEERAAEQDQSTDLISQNEEIPASGGDDGGGARTFSPLPPLPDGDSIPVAAFAERAYLEYAVSVVKGRALPDVADGQKPVQRRILYAMREMGMVHNTPHKKSARVVGEVLGKFHPHGDSSAYEAMVRLAQDFSLRYPLVDGQGNFGSRDGDNAAAMRYTEVRLTPLASLLLSELDMGTVDMVPNYDGHMTEPALLPARLPVVLLNGATGIAVGMATSIPSHNLREVGLAAAHCVRSPECTDEELLNFVTGPDLPGGGQIISSPQEIRDSYRTGRGSLKMRARWKVEELARGQWRIAVYELPHNTSTQTVLEEIEELTNPKIKTGKKALTQEQVQKKQLVLSVLDRVSDESDKDHAVRLVLEPKSGRQTPDEMMNVLLAHTSLEDSLSVNMVMIGADGRPAQKPLPTIMREWCQFRVDTVRRRTVFRLEKVNDRIHILEGRMVVFLNLDEVIALIRESDDPKPALIERFSLSDRQAEDILEIRLRQLAKMEGIKIEKELKELRDERAGLEKLLGSDALLRRRVAKEIDDDVAAFGDERRTLIEQAERITLAAAKVVDEPVTVIVSKKHWMRARQGHGLDLSGVSFKDGDGLLSSFECRTTDHCIVICSNGRVCSIPVHQLPSGRGDGAPVTTFIELAAGARVAHVLGGTAGQHVLISTAAGYGFTCTLGDMVGRNKAGKQFITVDKEEILPPVLFAPSDSAIVVSASRAGRLLAFLLEEMKSLSGGGKGVIVMELDSGDSMAGVSVATEPKVSLRLSSGKELVIGSGELQECFGKRARKGKSLGLKQKSFVERVL